MTTAADSAKAFIGADALAGIGYESDLQIATEAIEFDRDQRPSSANLKKAYDRWSEVFEGEQFYSDAQERAVQLDLAENLREYMEQIEPGEWV